MFVVGILYQRAMSSLSEAQEIERPVVVDATQVDPPDVVRRPVNSRVRWQGKNFFCTYPQCSLGHVEVYNLLSTKFSTLEFAVIGLEKHADGSPHVHVVFGLSKVRNFKNPSFADLGHFHGSYEVARDVHRCIDYAKKDGDFKVFPEGVIIEAITRGNGKKGVSTVVAELLAAGSTPRDIRVSYPGFYLQQGAKIRALYQELQAETSVLPPVGRAAFEEQISNALLDASLYWRMTGLGIGGVITGAQTVISWLRENFSGRIRAPRQKQLYLWGPPGIGKTRLIGRLQRYFCLYEIPNDIDYYSLYAEGAYQGMYIDEFRGQKRIQWMNRVLDGSAVTLNKKFGEVRKVTNHPVLVFSNVPLCEAYPEMSLDGSPGKVFFEALRDRFTEVQVTAEDMEVVDKVVAYKGDGGAAAVVDAAAASDDVIVVD